MLGAGERVSGALLDGWSIRPYSELALPPVVGGRLLPLVSAYCIGWFDSDSRPTCSVSASAFGSLNVLCLRSSPPDSRHGKRLEMGEGRVLDAAVVGEVAPAEYGPGWEIERG